MFQKKTVFAYFQIFSVFTFAHSSAELLWLCVVVSPFGKKISQWDVGFRLPVLKGMLISYSVLYYFYIIFFSFLRGWNVTSFECGLL